MNATQTVSNEAPVINLPAAQAFLHQLDDAGIFTFQTFADQKRGDSSLARVLHGTLDEHAEALKELNAKGAGIFVMVNEGDGVPKPGARTVRTEANVIRVRAVFVDLDGAPLEPVLESKAPPHLVVESSPKRWHAYWLVFDCPLDKFRAIQQQLARRFGGDP